MYDLRITTIVPIQRTASTSAMSARTRGELMPRGTKRSRPAGDDGLDDLGEHRVEDGLGARANVARERHPQELGGDALEGIAEASVRAFGEEREHQGAAEEGHGSAAEGEQERQNDERGDDARRCAGCGG